MCNRCDGIRGVDFRDWVRESPAGVQSSGFRFFFSRPLLAAKKKKRTGFPRAQRACARSPHNVTRCATAHTLHVARDVPPYPAGFIIGEGGRGKPGRPRGRYSAARRGPARMHASAAGGCGADPAGAGCAEPQRYSARSACPDTRVPRRYRKVEILTGGAMGAHMAS